jgi:hypothetical protein
MTPDSTMTRPRGDHPRGEFANVLSLTALIPMIVAYVTMFAVLGDGNYASKFENGELPAGVDPTSGHTAAVTSLICALAAFALIGGALASRVTKTSGSVFGLLVLVGMPYALVEFVVWQLAF